MSSRNKIHTHLPILLLVLLTQYTNCGIYSLQGAATAARNIQVEDFYNNTDLASANIASTFTNKLKDYYQQNSALRIVDKKGELQIEGTITNYAITSRAPTASQSFDQPDAAALSQLEIVVTVSYKDSLEPGNNFKDKTFSFAETFSNSENFIDIREDLEDKIFDQILLNMFNATVANW